MPKAPPPAGRVTTMLAAIPTAADALPKHTNKATTTRSKASRTTVGVASAGCAIVCAVVSHGRVCCAMHQHCSSGWGNNVCAQQQLGQQQWVPPVLGGTSNRAWLSVGALPCRATQSDYMHANKTRRRVHKGEAPCGNWCEGEFERGSVWGRGEARQCGGDREIEIVWPGAR